jgi:hypothetical protein
MSTDPQSLTEAHRRKKRQRLKIITDDLEVRPFFPGGGSTRFQLATKSSCCGVYRYVSEKRELQMVFGLLANEMVNFLRNRWYNSRN